MLVLVLVTDCVSSWSTVSYIHTLYLPACLSCGLKCSVRPTLDGGTAEGLPGACDRGVCWIKYTMERIPLTPIFH